MCAHQLLSGHETRSFDWLRGQGRLAAVGRQRTRSERRRLASREFDVVLYQQRSHWERDQEFQFPDSLLRPRYHLLKCRASQNVDADANTRRALTRL